MHSALNLYSQKTENRKVFWFFQGIEKGSNGNEWVKEEKVILYAQMM